MTKPILAWHFLPANKRLQHGDNRLVRAGCTYRYRGTEPIALGEAGMHASTDILDALKYAGGPMLCRVEMSGEMIQGDDQLVATARKVLWVIPADAMERVLRLWAGSCVRRVWPLLYASGREAVRTAERCANGRATGEELADRQLGRDGGRSW